MKFSTVAAAVLPAVAMANDMAPLHKRTDAIANEYIVSLKEEASMSAESSALKLLKVKPEYVWKSAINGFAATMDEKTLNAMRLHPDVVRITENGLVRATGWEVPGTEAPMNFTVEARADDYLTQEKPVYGLARVSHKTTKQTTYQYHKSQGEGICAWIVDSGIDDKHTDFEGRGENVKNWIKGEENKDLFNHGTHCAGTVGSKTYGVAKKVKLLSLKVLGRSGSGPDAGVVDAINWLIENGPKRTECKGHVVNMSFGADNIHPEMKAACAKLVKLGMHVAVASGNGNRDAGKDSPGDEPTVCTVAATDANDSKASFSNHGKLIDINAPGVSVDSTIPGNKKSQMSGTSMAAPHICGLGALLMTEKGIKGGVVCDELVKIATKGALKGLNSATPNLLGFNGNPNAK